MPSANFKRNIKRIKAKLATDFEPAVATPTAGAVGTGKLFIAGQIFDGTIGGVTQVVNVGRPAAAQYAAKTGGSVVVSSGGGGSTTTGGTTVDLTSLYGAPYLTVAADTALTNERTLAVSSAFTLTDAGSNSTLTLALTTPGTLAHDSTNVATGSHTHAITASDAPGAAASLLKSSAAGLLTLPQFTATTQVRTPLIDTVSGDLALSPFTGITTGAQFTATTKVTTPLIDTASGDLSLTPATGITTGAQFTATTSLTTPLITTATNIDLVINPAGTGAVQFPNDQKLRTTSFDSSFPINGWQINEVEGVSGYSSLTIGKIQADELAVRVFVADEVRVDRGDEYWTKSYGIVAETFTSPSALDGTVSVMFEDSPALAGAIFTNNDWVLFRKLEIDTGISLFNLWGQVSSYVDNGDGTQNWTFTLKVGPTDEEILKGSLAIDFGATGAALIHLSVIDSAGAPYIKMRRWVTNPYTPANYTTYVQLGNLGSIGNSYYTPSGYGFYIRSTANEDQFMVADDNGLQIRGATFSLYNGADQTVLMDNASGINLDEDVWGSFENQRAVQWWSDVSSMTGDPSLSIYTGRVVGGFTDDQNFSYIDANPTGGVLAGLSLSAFGQGTANDALLYLEGGSQSLATDSSVTVTADQIDLVGITTMGTGRADQFNPTSDLGADLGTTLLRWNILYVDQIVVSGAISGDTISGQEWEYPGSMVIDANSASDTTLTVTNQGTGAASLDVEGNITLAGTVDGVDIALFKSTYDSHIANFNAHHNQSHVLATTTALGADHTVSGLTAGHVLRALSATTMSISQLQHSELGALTTGDPHTQYLLRAGGNLTGNVTANGGVTIDGVDISVHAADPDAHHAKQHNVTDATVHTITSSALGLVGATATNTIGIITPSASPGAAGAVLRSDNSGVLTLVQLNTTTKLQTPLIDTASGNLALAPVGGTVAVTGTVNASTSVLTPSISTPSGNLFLSAVGGAVLVQPSVMLQSDYFTSQLVGWRMTYNGELDTRYIYTDQLHAKAFIADLEQALAGSQIITKSVTTVAQSFVVPYPGASLPLYVDDLPSAEDMAVFESGDFVRLREFDRVGGTLSITDCWGTVSSYTDQADKVQRWSFTRSGTASVNTISQVGTVQTANSSGATSRSVSKVSGTASGHRMIAQVVINNTSVTITPPSGWSLLTSGTATGVKMAIYTKVAGGSEPSSYTFSFSSSVACAVSLVCLRNVVSVYSSQVNSQSTPTNSMVGLSNLSLSTSDYYLFYGGIAGNIRGVAPDGMSEIADFGATGVCAFSAFDLLDMPGDYGDVAATLASNAAYVCITLDLIPTYATGGLDTTSGLMAPGTVIAPDAIVLDYGVSGNGWHEVTTVDGLYGSNSPYARIASWTTHPATGAQVRTQTGHLRGLFGVANEYGFYAGSGVTTADNYLRLSSNTAQFNNIPISMYSGGTERMRINTSYGIDMYMPSVYDEVAAISWRSTLNTGTAGARIHAHDESDATGLYLESIASGAADNKAGYINLSAYDNDQTLMSQIAMLAPNVGNSYVRISANEVDLGVSTSEVTIEGTKTIVNSYLGVTGPVSETALGVDNVRIGIVSGAPRIIFEDASATQWEIDNVSGALRFFVPGTVHGQFTGYGFQAITNLFAGGITFNGQDGVRLVTSAGYGYIDTKGSGGLIFRYDNTDGSTERMRITSGTVSVTGNLAVTGNCDIPAIHIAPATGWPQEATIKIDDANCSASWGPHITLGRNNNGSTPSAGWLRMTRRDGHYGDLWVDGSHVLRIGYDSAVTSSTDTTGSVVGLQVSSLSAKTVLGDTVFREEAVAHVRHAAQNALRHFTYKSGAFNGEEFDGLITDYAPRYGMDRDEAHPAGRALNVIQLINDLLLSVDYLYEKVQELSK